MEMSDHGVCISRIGLKNAAAYSNIFKRAGRRSVKAYKLVLVLVYDVV
jgi:hypothetical protein